MTKNDFERFKQMIWTDRGIKKTSKRLIAYSQNYFMHLPIHIIFMVKIKGILSPDFQSTKAV